MFLFLRKEKYIHKTGKSAQSQKSMQGKVIFIHSMFFANHVNCRRMSVRVYIYIYRASRIGYPLYLYRIHNNKKFKQVLMFKIH